MKVQFSAERKTEGRVLLRMRGRNALDRVTGKRFESSRKLNLEGNVEDIIKSLLGVTIDVVTLPWALVEKCIDLLYPSHDEEADDSS